MDDENNKKTPYNYRILAGVDRSIAAGRDFVVGRGWAPLVNVGICRNCEMWLKDSADEYRVSYVENQCWQTTSPCAGAGI